MARLLSLLDQNVRTGFKKKIVFQTVFRIRIRIKFVSWIRIRIRNADPDPAADKISSKSQNNSYHLELFD